MAHPAAMKARRVKTLVGMSRPFLGLKLSCHM
jgi:hypothetical protein